jgi:hypothetical protein
MEQQPGQVFWLVDCPTCHDFPFHSRGTVALSVAFVPTHSGGSATVSNRLPYTQTYAYLIDCITEGDIFVNYYFGRVSGMAWTVCRR